MEPNNTHGNDTESGFECEGGVSSSESILFIFFSLVLGVATRQVINGFKIPVPYTVCLLLLGVAWAALTTTSGFGHLGEASCLLSDIEPTLLLIIFLPMLIFESAFSLDWHAFKAVVGPALILAVPGLLMGIFLTGAVIHNVILPEFNWNSSFLLATILSATDPVAVVALLKELGGPKKMATLIESESLLNDGTAIVAYELFLELASGVELTGAEGVEAAFRLSLGGPSLGLLWGIITIFWIGRVIDDDLAEVTITLLSAYLLFFVAEDILHVSAVLALVVLGASFAAYGKTRISPGSEHSTHTFWRILTYHGNTLIFVFVGIVLVLNNDFNTIEGKDWGLVILLWVFLYLIRAAMILVFALPLRWSGYNIKWKDGFVIAHGGLRGAVSLALALSVSLGGGNDDHGGLPTEVRDKTLFYTGGVVFLTLVVNASTTAPILRAFGMVKEAAAQKQVFKNARGKVYKNTKSQIKTMARDPLFSMANWDQIVEFLNFSHEATIDFKDQDFELNQKVNNELVEKESKARNSVGVQANRAYAANATLGDIPEDSESMDNMIANPLHGSFSSDPTTKASVSHNSEEEDIDNSHLDEDFYAAHKISRRVTFSEKRVRSIFTSVKKPKNKETVQEKRNRILKGAKKTKAKSHSEADLQNARLVLLSFTRSLYWEFFESGFLSRSVVQELVLSCEAEIEKVKRDSTKQLQIWSPELQAFVSTPWYVRAIFKVQKFLPKQIYNRLLRNLALRRAKNIVNLVDAFVAVHRKALAELSGAISVAAASRKNLHALVDETRFCLNAARASLYRLHDLDISTVRSTQAAALLLFKQEHSIKEKFKHGLFTEIEFEHLIAHIRALRSQVILKSPSFKFPKASCIMRFTRIFADLSKDARRDLLKAIIPHHVPKGNKLLQMDKKTSGLFILVRGFVSIEYPTSEQAQQSRTSSINSASSATLASISESTAQTSFSKDTHKNSPNSEVLYPGSILGAIEAVSGCNGLVNVTATSDRVHLALLTHPVMKELSERHPSFKKSLERIGAYHLLFLKRRKLFSTASRAYPPAKVIARAPFGIQEQLWPYAEAGEMHNLKSGDHVQVPIAAVVVSGSVSMVVNSPYASRPAVIPGVHKLDDPNSIYEDIDRTRNRQAKKAEQLEVVVSKFNTPFDVLQQGEYVCQSPGRVFVLTPTVKKSKDVFHFEEGSSSEGSSDEGSDTEHGASSDDDDADNHGEIGHESEL